MEKVVCQLFINKTVNSLNVEIIRKKISYLDIEEDML